MGINGGEYRDINNKVYSSDYKYMIQINVCYKILTIVITGRGQNKLAKLKKNSDKIIKLFP